MASPGVFGGVGLGNPFPKLLGPSGKVPRLAIGTPPAGPLLLVREGSALRFPHCCCVVLPGDWGFYPGPCPRSVCNVRVGPGHHRLGP